LFVGFLISDKLYSKLKGLLGFWVGGSEVVTSLVFEAGLGLVKEDNTFNVVGEVVCGSAVYASGGARLKVEGDRSS
jgi:hypothetical protein